MTVPPRFTPRRSDSRPEADNARVVGASGAPPTTRPSRAADAAAVAGPAGPSFTSGAPIVERRPIHGAGAPAPSPGSYRPSTQSASSPSPAASALPPSFTPAARSPRPDQAPATAPTFSPSSTPIPVGQGGEPLFPPVMPARTAATPPTSHPDGVIGRSSGARVRPGMAPSYTPGSHQNGTPPAGPTRPTKGKGGRNLKRSLIALGVVLVLLLAWPVGLGFWANGKLKHTEALSGAANTVGTTWLLAGSDVRGNWAGDDTTEGARTDTIMLVHKPPRGPVALISLPRDTYVKIPGHGPAKLNAAYAYGGPKLLVATVEGLTGLTIDHYVEINLSGVRDIVDAVGGVKLCLDYNVNDEDSGLVWKAGCHVTAGEQAMAFVRMRHADPLGDIGRAARQRQLISSLTKKIVTPGFLLNPSRHIDLVNAGTGALVTSKGSNIITLAQLALAFKDAIGDGGVMGTPPIANMGYEPGGIGSTVLLDPDKITSFFQKIMDGSMPPGVVGGLE